MSTRIGIILAAFFLVALVYAFEAATVAAAFARVTNQLQAIR